jgi:hypothetical protein
MIAQAQAEADGVELALPDAEVPRMPPSSISPSDNRIARQLSQWICGLHGHDTVLRMGADRLHLQCRHCGHQSPGWPVGPSARQASVSGPRQLSGSTPSQTALQTQ